MSVRRTLAMVRKELRHIRRDARSLLMALALPMFLMLLFGYALNLDVDRIPTLVYDADQSPESRSLVQKFQGSRFFEIEGFVDNYSAIERGIDRGDILMALAIPRDYSRRIRAGEPVAAQILLDGSDSNTASIALGYAQSIVQDYSVTLRSEGADRRFGIKLQQAVDARTRVWYNSTLQSKNYVVPGLIAVILTIIAALLTSLTIAREWEMGTMEQLMSTPVRPSEIVLGKMLAFFFIGVADTVLSVLVGVFVFDVPFSGSVWVLALTSTVFLTGALFWGILLSAVAKSQLMAFQMGIISSFLPAFMLSGFIYAVENMPPAIQAITRLIPTRFFVTILKGIFLKGVGLEVLWTDLLYLAGFSIVVFLLATRRLRQKLA
ncbi:MAG TPA: ABC transporter permease [Bryobacteraceae bacterium]|nr:ABC transporter permease [Bryobacteraceae bacterium]